MRPGTRPSVPSPHRHSARRAFPCALLLIVLIACAGVEAFAQTIQQQAVAVAATALTSTSKPRPKRLASVRISDTAEGSRVIVTSDASLEDYEARSDGGRFYVLIPNAAEPRMPEGLRGRGFTDAQVGMRGSDVLLTFGLEPGAGARVLQLFNRLEVVFTSAGARAAEPQIGSSPTPTPTPPAAALSAVSGTTPAPSPSPVPPTAKSPSESTTATTVPTNTAASPQTAQAPANAVMVAGVALPSEKASPVRIFKFDKPPVIDGKLDEAGWQTAAVLKDFYQTDPGYNTKPSFPTETYIGYDSRFLYVGFRAHDEPGKVRATVAKRDNVLGVDDTIRILLDTFNDQRKAYVLVFNPFGIQQDGLRTEGSGVDFNVDVVMTSKGVVTDDGYTIEVAIPFKSLRYTAGKDKLWGVQVFRQIMRFNGENDSWMPLSRDVSSILAQAGHITGLEGISTERTLELIPSLTISETGRNVRSLTPPPAGVVDQGRIVNEPLDFDPGLTAKFGISPNVTLDLALNPDFAQVEADQLVVTTNQRFPIFFAEKRPFFLEGIDIFQTPLLVVHTRSIVDPDVAVKLSGKQGRNTFGLMVASDNGPGNLSADDRGALFSCIERRQLNPLVVCNNERFVDKNAYVGVLRLKHDLGKGESTVGMIATSYNFIEKHNQVLGFDGRFRLNPKTIFNFQLLGSTSRNFFYDPNTDQDDYRTGNGAAYSVTYDVSGKNFGWQLYGEGFTNNYRNDVGFLGRVNTNFNSLYARYDTDPKTDKKSFIISRHVHNFTWIGYDFQGRIQNWESENYIEWRLKRSSWFSLAWEPAYERILEEEFGPKRTATRQGAFYGEDDERSVQKNHFFIAGGSQPNKKVSFSGRAVWRLNHLDLDFGGGRRYPRVSPSAIARRTCIEDGTDPDKCPLDPLDPGAGNLFEFSGGIAYQPTNALRMSLNIIKNRLVRKDTGRTAFDTNIFTLRSTYQFTKFTFARAIIDYNTLNTRTRGQFLMGWTPNPGTALYVGYNDDLNYGFNNLSRQIVPGFRRNSRTFFIKMSYLFRKSFE